VSAYKYTLSYDLSIWWGRIGLDHLNTKVEDISQWSDGGKVWLTLSPAGMTVSEFYAWDGCDLAPDTPRTRAASAIHDALYQFKGREGFPLSRRDCDAIFYRVLRRDGFRAARLYWVGVRMFGWVA